MVDPRKLHVAGVRDLRGQLLAGAPVDDPVAVPVEDERRNMDRGQDGSHVDVQEHLEDLLDHRRARGGALQTGGELRRLGIVREARSEELDHPLRVLPPVGGDELGGGLAKRLRGRGPGIVGRLGGAPHRAVEHQSSHALGVSGREQDAHRPALGDPEKGRPLGPRGVHDRPDVVDPQLERRHLGDGVRQPGAALVEDDQARERAEPLEEASERRRLPLEFEMGGEAEDEDHVDRPVADDLVGDRGVAGLGVLCRRRGHWFSRGGPSPRDTARPHSAMLIGAPGFEPGTSPTRTVRATRLRYAPTVFPIGPNR